MKVLLLAFQLMSQADFIITQDGQARCVAVRQAGLTAVETNALNELVTTLQQITGARFDGARDADRPFELIVGSGDVARARFPEVRFDQLRPEEYLIKTKGNVLLLAGGRPRGTLYAVSRFLQEHCGVRWWTPWASRIPKRPSLVVGRLDVRTEPRFEYREPYWYSAFDALWAVRNGCNGQSAGILPEWGGAIRYKGFVHTFYELVPPSEHFAQHPEWFSLIKEKRSTDRAQLCLTNPQLRDFVIERVKKWLRESPEARIVSVSQNDWDGACECTQCQAVVEAEGSQAGPVLAFVNDIAERIEPEFPEVAIDTLAYRYTRQPPKTVRPRSNVIVRLCSIECNFREPLDHGVNAKFAEDIRGWSKLCQRLYIWDYTTDFAHYVQPHPNWFTLGPNARFFAQHNVRGVFEQGAYQSHGGEMAELRAWLLAQLLWNPKQDDRALIREFLEGYYGAGAAPFIGQYLELLHAASEGHNLTCYSGTDAPFLRFDTLAQAEQLWRKAEAAVATDEDLLARVRLGHVPLGYVWLSRWKDLRQECTKAGASWPLEESREDYLAKWLSSAQGEPGKPWTQVRWLNEGRSTLENFAEHIRKNL